MAKKKARTNQAAIASDPIWVTVVDSQKRRVAKNVDYRLMASHLGTISKHQVPRSEVRGMYNRLWPLISPQSFRHYVLPAYMAVPDIDRSIKDWDDKCLFSDKDGHQWPRLYVLESFNYDRQDKDQAPEDMDELAAPVVPWKRDEEISLLLAMAIDETTKPYLKPAIREIDPDYDPLDEDQPVKPGLFQPERKVETLADMFGFAGDAEGEKVVLSQVVEKKYQILVSARAVTAFNAVKLKAIKSKKKLTGIDLRKKAIEILAKESVLCYPTFCALLGEDKTSIQAFLGMLAKEGYHRTGTVGKTAIFRPWAEMYPEGVPAHVLKDAGEVPA